MLQGPDATLLFHISDTLTDHIVPSGSRPKFYWFNDCYHDHYNFSLPAMSYLYFFLIQPRNTAAKLFTRHGAGDFQSMWADYAEYLRRREINERNAVREYLEPGIVFSFSEMVPDVTCKFVDGFTVAAKARGGSSEVTFRLEENGKLRRYDQIPELVNLLPGLVNAAPLVRPSQKDIEDLNGFWPADFANQGRMWL